MFCTLQHDPVLASRWKDWEVKGLARLSAILDMAGDRLRNVDKETAAFVIYQSVEATCHRTMLYGGGPSPEQLVDGLTDMITCYLMRRDTA